MSRECIDRVGLVENVIARPANQSITRQRVSMLSGEPVRRNRLAVQPNRTDPGGLPATPFTVSVRNGIVVSVRGQLSALNRDQKARFGDLLATRTVVMDGTRHIVSTTLTTAGGFLPLILFGETFWPPLAIAIVGGLVGATVLALLFVPAMFTYIARRNKRSRARGGAGDIAQPTFAETAG